MFSCTLKLFLYRIQYPNPARSVSRFLLVTKTKVGQQRGIDQVFGRIGEVILT